MEDVNVIKLPVTEERLPAKKRTRPPKFDPREEDQERQTNVKRLAGLGETDESVKLLEELLFGAEDELVDRLVEQEEEQTGASLVEDGDDGACDSEDQDPQDQVQTREPVWVDEDDELEEEVDMKHRYRRDLIRGEAESTMTNQRLQERMRQQ
ncbi:U3 small nucleolar RNA-associated protein 18 homolog [Anarrhichthys ocellatus]|uniref:U3 small nucleolar RNA-associated protein 18 homolog n=1 Tax=Anarrhichthys ocellatus TaxID=433405 RepID=UPI0012EE765A|nr:U3 small nucleolar RNA-associated protein 18 homolog [Anarrhichthys ocellatus]